jgi:hypothetical protein
LFTKVVAVALAGVPLVVVMAGLVEVMVGVVEEEEEEAGVVEVVGVVLTIEYERIVQLGSKIRENHRAFCPSVMAVTWALIQLAS